MNFRIAAAFPLQATSNTQAGQGPTLAMAKVLGSLDMGSSSGPESEAEPDRPVWLPSHAPPRIKWLCAQQMRWT